MKNLSLNVKVGFIIGIMCVSACGIGYLGISKMSAINDAMDEIAGPLTIKDQTTSKILVQMQTTTIMNKEILTEDSLHHIEEIEKKLAVERDILNKAIDDFEKMTEPEEKEILNKFKEQMSAMSAINRKNRALIKEKKLEQVQKIIDDEEKPLRAELYKTLELMSAHTAKDLAAKTDEAHADFDSAKKNVLIIIVSSILFTLILSVIIMKSVSNAINNVILSLDDNSTQVSSAAGQISSASQQLSQAATQQAASLEETAASVEEMNSMINKNSENAKNVASVASESQDVAATGKDAVAKMMQSMDEINTSNTHIMEQVTESNNQIAEIVKVITEIGNKTKVINDIVFQTKLLSFNASVEAARAGEHGKGFAVVAEEVGNLAQMSGNAAKEISSMLESSIQKVESIVNDTKTKVERLIQDGKVKVEAGTEVARQCSEVLEEIVKKVSTATEMAHEISTATGEQARGIQEITKAMAQLDQVTQQNAATSEEAASSAEELSAQADSLKSVVNILVQTIKGGSNHTVAHHPTIKPTPKKEVKTEVINKVVHMKSKSSPEATTFKKASGDDSTPSYDDSRFKDV